KTNWRLSNGPPPDCVDFDGPPTRIAEIDIKLTKGTGDAHVNCQFVSIIASLSLENGNGRLQGLVARRAPTRLLKPLGEHQPKGSRSYRPGLAIPIDTNIGVGRAIRRVE